MWFVFISMSTVGFGDFYPNTQIGRIISILACSIGVYYVSMLIVFMTKTSVLEEKETKAYQLITRFNYRKIIKNLQSKIIYHALKLGILIKQVKRYEISVKTFAI